MTDSTVEEPVENVTACIEFAEVLRFQNGLTEDWTERADVRVVYTLVYISIFVVGLIGNGLLISILLRGRYSVANLFLINLAISDLLLCITSVPISPAQAFFKLWYFGNLLCKIVPFSQAVSVLVSTYCLCFIALDRYRSIVLPTQEPWSIRKSQLYMSLSWLLACTISSPLYITQKTIKFAMQGYSICGECHDIEFCGEFDWEDMDYRIMGMTSKQLYGTIILMIQFVIPAIIITFSYWKILQKVRVDWIVEEGSMLTATQQAQTAVRKRRVMYVLILMVVVFMLAWLPITVSNILRDFQVGMHNQLYFHMLNANALAMSSVVWNPLLYFWLSKRHRRALKEDMFWLTNAKRQPSAGVLARFAPSPSVSFVYRRTLERHLGSHPFRRGTLADPTNMMRESIPRELQPNCFLLVPLMPLCQTIRKNSTLAVPGTRQGLLSPRMNTAQRRPSTGTVETGIGA